MFSRLIMAGLAGFTAFSLSLGPAGAEIAGNANQAGTGAIDGRGLSQAANRDENPLAAAGITGAFAAGGGAGAIGLLNKMDAASRAQALADTDYAMSWYKWAGASEETLAEIERAGAAAAAEGSSIAELAATGLLGAGVAAAIGYGLDAPVQYVPGQNAPVQYAPVQYVTVPMSAQPAPVPMTTITISIPMFGQ